MTEIATTAAIAAVDRHHVHSSLSLDGSTDNHISSSTSFLYRPIEPTTTAASATTSPPSRPLQFLPATKTRIEFLFEAKPRRRRSNSAICDLYCEALQVVDTSYCVANHFEKTLKKMCKNCKGVPLALKLLGNLVVWSWKTDRNIDLKGLQQRSCVSVQDLLELSYSLLPEDLMKKCLHYLALFPKETVDIEADKLCNLWIAEEMITTSQQAETYLKQLASLGLVQVQEEETPTPTPTKIKSCSLPHYVRDFLCRVETEEQSLFATEDLRTRSSSNQEARRPQVRGLAFYFDKRVGDDKFPLKPKKTHENVRSILFLNTRQQDAHLLSPKSLDLTNCKLLRALDFNWLHFRAINFPQGINNLAHLRYLSFRDCYLENFPPSIIGKMEKLETLDLRVNKPEVVCKIERISEVLSQLKRLRSLYLPKKFAAETGDETNKLQLGHLTELENLQNFVSTHCRAKDLCSLTKLRFLGATIVGKVQDLDETIKCLKEGGTSKSSSIHLENIDFTNDRYQPDAFTALSELLACESLNALHVHGQIGTLPRPISDKLAEIFLIDSELKEDPMPLLGKLGNLQKLGLSNNAFLVEKITCTKSAGFPQLRYLKLSTLPKLKTWTIQKGAMLKLSTLIIENCKSLKTLPDGLEHVLSIKFDL
nr:probable disease resistance protein At1g58602 [Ipomoea batatas]GME01167.1 probable disease resistance protein At1g58602 [Ipomoea batatas]GME16367.1 probable disease resistance protein At1g58602 [Ipomoea batatas]GME20363.1 probable disease resistance protein At1g58602 [Ipomoea batatas]